MHPAHADRVVALGRLEGGGRLTHEDGRNYYQWLETMGGPQPTPEASSPKSGSSGTVV